MLQDWFGDCNRLDVPVAIAEPIRLELLLLLVYFLLE